MKIAATATCINQSNVSPSVAGHLPAMSAAQLAADPAAYATHCNSFVTFILLTVGVLLPTVLLATLKSPVVEAQQYKTDGVLPRLHHQLMEWFDLQEGDSFAKPTVFYLVLVFCYHVSFITAMISAK